MSPRRLPLVPVRLLLLPLLWVCLHVSLVGAQGLPPGEHPPENFAPTLPLDGQALNPFCSDVQWVFSPNRPPFENYMEESGPLAAAEIAQCEIVPVDIPGMLCVAFKQVPAGYINGSVWWDDEYVEPSSDASIATKQTVAEKTLQPGLHTIKIRVTYRGNLVRPPTYAYIPGMRSACDYEWTRTCEIPEPVAHRGPGSDLPVGALGTDPFDAT